MNRLALILWLLTPISGHAGAWFRPSPRLAQQGELIYLLMPDRFARGDIGHGAMTPDAQEGLNPKDSSFFHGGNLRGVQEHLDYLQHLEVTSIWMTPIMKNRAVQDYAPVTCPKQVIMATGSWTLPRWIRTSGPRRACVR